MSMAFLELAKKYINAKTLNHRNIFVSESDPSAADGQDGDLWFVVEPVNEPYYTEGVENVDWAVGYSNGNGSQSKEEGYLYLEVSNNATEYANRTYVTDSVVDLTLINKLSFELEQYETAVGYNTRLIVAAEKLSQNGSTYCTLHQDIPGDKARATYEIDVSSLTGSYYVKVAARDTSTTVDRTGKIKVYKVWGES